MHNKFSEYMKLATESKTALAAPEVPNFKQQTVKAIAAIIEKSSNSTEAAQQIVSRFIHNNN